MGNANSDSPLESLHESFKIALNFSKLSYPKDRDSICVSKMKCNRSERHVHKETRPQRIESSKAPYIPSSNRPKIFPSANPSETPCASNPRYLTELGYPWLPQSTALIAESFDQCN
jgi:hypothetical protein